MKGESGYYWVKVHERSSWRIMEYDDDFDDWEEDEYCHYNSGQLFKINETRILNPDEDPIKMTTLKEVIKDLNK